MLAPAPQRRSPFHPLPLPVHLEASRASSTGLYYPLTPSLLLSSTGQGMIHRLGVHRQHLSHYALSPLAPHHLATAPHACSPRGNAGCAIFSRTACKVLTESQVVGIVVRDAISGCLRRRRPMQRTERSMHVTHSATPCRKEADTAHACLIHLIILRSFFSRCNKVTRHGG